MSRQDRNSSYYGRDEGRYEDRDPRQRSPREGDRDEQRYRTQADDWGRSSFDSEYEQQRYGSRSPDERDYSARYLGYEARYEPRESQRFPASFGSYDDQGRARRYEDDSDYGRYGSGDRERWNQSSQSGQGRYSSSYGSGRNLDVSGSASYGYGSRYDYGRDATQNRYGQRDWGQRGEYARDYEREASGREDYRYGGERPREGFGQQLREAGQEVVRKVKRAFRGPKGYKRSDERIREDVNDRLANQDSFDPSEIEVSVQGAEVTLTGSVRSRHEKFLAEEIADDVSGVTEVHNQLRVRREQVTSLTTGTGAESTATGTTTGSSWSGQNAGAAASRKAHS